MTLEPQPDDAQIPLIRKILKDYPDGFWAAVHQEYARISQVRKILGDYPDRISAIKVPPPSPPQEAGGKDSINVLSEKLASLEQRINLEIREEKGVFQKVSKKIESELANAPARQFVQPDAPAETGQGAGRSSGPPYSPPSPDSHTGGAAIHLPSAGAPDPVTNAKTAPARSKTWIVLTILFLAVVAGGVWRYINSN